MHQRGDQHDTGKQFPGVVATHFQHAVDKGRKYMVVVHDAEKQYGKHEHDRHRGNSGYPQNHVAGHRHAFTGNQRAGNRNSNKGNQRGETFADDSQQHGHNGQKAGEC